jgi:hypothetical protein
LTRRPDWPNPRVTRRSRNRLKRLTGRLSSRGPLADKLPPPIASLHSAATRTLFAFPEDKTLSPPGPLPAICSAIGGGLRQLPRLFQREAAGTPAEAEARNVIPG